MSVSMNTIVRAIAEDIDIYPELIERAIEAGFAERIKRVVLTEAGEALFEHELRQLSVAYQKELLKL